MERWSSCPACERSVRLTERELEAKRGFCAACDATFELRMGAMRDQMVPFRETAPLDLVVAGPESSAVRIQDEGHPALLLGSARRPGWTDVPLSWPVTALVLWGLVGVGLKCFSPKATTLLFALYPFVAIVSAVAVRFAHDRFGHDRLEIRGGRLWLERWGRKWRSVPLAEVREIRIEDEATDNSAAPSRRRFRLRIEMTVGGKWLVGAGLGHEAATIDWVRRWLETSLWASASGETTASEAFPGPTSRLRARPPAP